MLSCPSALGTPTLEDSGNEPPVVHVALDRLADCGFDPLLRVLGLGLAELVSDHGGQHTDVRLVEGEDVGARSPRLGR